MTAPEPIRREIAHQDYLTHAAHERALEGLSFSLNSLFSQRRERFARRDMVGDFKMEDIKQADWVFDPGRRFVRYFFDASYILHLSVEGIEARAKHVNPSTLEFAGRIAETVLSGDFRRRCEADPASAKQLEDYIDNQMRLGFFAKDEQDRGFPLIRAHTLVSYWGSLEVFFDDLVLACLMNDPAILSHEALSKVKVPLADFETLSREDRMRQLVEEMKRQAKAGIKNGVNQFENTLAIIGLGGPVEKRVSDGLYETQQLRNLIVHRASVVDRQFDRACPNSGFAVGETVVVDKARYECCRDSIGDYVLCLTRRIWSRYCDEELDDDSLISMIVKPVREATKPPVEIKLL